MPSAHLPVMLPQVLSHLNPQPGDVVMDVTCGCGGYSTAIRERLGTDGLLLASDRDPEMAAATRERLGKTSGCPFRVFVALFSQIEEVLAEAGVEAVNGLVADLGVASPQIDRPERGFSYRKDGPLSMQMTSGTGLDAADIVNRWPEEQLADCLYQYGEERFARRIARRICDRRRARPIRSTLELAEIIQRAVPKGRRKHHPARKSFQAIRMACNRETEELEALVQALPSVLAPRARVIVVSYHSLEDRIVKQAFADGKRTGLLTPLTRKVERPSEAEIARNPRSRSGRLRAARRVEEDRR